MNQNEMCPSRSSRDAPNLSLRDDKSVNLTNLKSPHLFRGNGIEREKLVYYTSNSEYGKFSPSSFTVPLRFYPQSHHFSRLMFTTKRRNLSLNCN